MLADSMCSLAGQKLSSPVVFLIPMISLVPSLVLYSTGSMEMGPSNH